MKKNKSKSEDSSTDNKTKNGKLANDTDKTKTAKEKDNAENKTENEEEKTKLSDKVAIGILSALIFCLLFYMLSSRYIGNKRLELADNYLSYTANQTEENNDEAEAPENLLVNINSDNISELMRLKGIGKVKAAAIIEYRKEHGDFTDINEIKNVSGIGEATFEAIKDYIYIP